MQDLAGVAIDKIEAERCGLVAEATEHTSTLL
jgi:hypothetical protein